MSNDQKDQRNQSQQSAKMSLADAEAMKKKIETIVRGFLAKFYAGQKEVLKAMGGGTGNELWDLRMTSRGLTVELYVLEDGITKNFPILVSSHPQHMKPDVAKVALDGWRQIVDSGALRS